MASDTPPKSLLNGNSLYYRLSLLNENWWIASQKAAALGGYLLSIDSAQEQDFVARSIGVFFSEVVTGLSDLNADGIYQKPDGSALTYSNFLPGYPYPSGIDQPNAYALLISRTHFRPWEFDWSVNQWYSMEMADTKNTSIIDPISGEPQTGVYAEVPLTCLIAFSTAPREGGGIITTSISLYAGNEYTGNLANGTTVYWTVSGITPDDLETGSMSGSGIIVNGSLILQHALKIDSDSGEQFQVSAFSDGSATQRIGSAATIGILEQQGILGTSIYTIVDGSSWTQAEESSVKLGGHLTSILSASENDWLLTNFIPNLQSSYWIGASDQAQEGNWQWSDGSPWSYSNWEVGQPDNASNEDYAQFVPGWNGKWNDLPLTYTVPGIQKTDKGIAKIPFIRRGNSAYVIVQGPTWEEAEANAVKLGGHLIAINDKQENDWLSTITYRTSDRIQASYWIGLTDRDIEGTWKWLSGDAYGFSQWNQGEPNSFDAYAGPEDYVVIGSNSTSPTWIDVADSNTFYRNWGWDSLGIAEIKLAPNNTPTGIPIISGSTRVGSTLAIDKTPIRDSDNFTGYDVRYSYKWEISTDGNLWSRLTTPDATDNNATYTPIAAESGKSIRGTVSYVDGYGTMESVATAATVVASMANIYGSYLYTIVEGGSWQESETKSVLVGGHLTSILSASENDWLLSNLITNLQSSYWIGASDQAQEGNWQWSDGSPWSYSNWEVGQPDNASNEDYAQFVPGWNGKWNDLPLTYTVPGIQKTDKGIAKIPFIRRGNSAYVIVQGPTWEEAEANAVKLGGHLVAINDKEENDWLSTITYRNPDKIQASYWIGLTDRDTEGTWKWLSGDAYEFSQWYVGHPNSFDAGPEDYVVIGSNSTSPTWINISNSNTFYRNWGWDSLGIAEIKLAPNNAPTGIPIISGSTRVGSTLAIDTTPIRDSDNFTGYNVRYSYEWEVSTDGNLWSRLTTPDATDNSASYTLTAAESGKSIRGIVTYIDGYGTHESVATPFYGGISNEHVIGKESLVNNGDALIDTAHPTNRIRLLTVPHGKGSAWWNSAVDLRLDWSTSFYVTAFNGSGTSDGFTFSINGDPRGTAAIGGGGQNLGFFGANGEYGVSGSYAVLFDMWTTQPASQLGFSKSTDSFIPEAPFGLPISLANNAYNVTISYSSSRGTLDVSVGGQTFSQSVNLESVIGSSGYLGFTAANGGGTMDTDISNWNANATHFLPSINLASSQSQPQKTDQIN